MERTLLNADAMEISPFNICVKCFKLGAVQLHAHFCHFERLYSAFCCICTDFPSPDFSTQWSISHPHTLLKWASVKAEISEANKAGRNMLKFNCSVLVLLPVKNKWGKKKKKVKYFSILRLFLAQVDRWTFQYKNGKFGPNTSTMLSRWLLLHGSVSLMREWGKPVW